MKKFGSEFKEFLSRGNVAELAAGVIIGSAFSAVVNAFAANLITPLIAAAVQAATGEKDFSGLKFMIGTVEFTYGNVITAIINFLLTAFILFLMIKALNRIGRAKKRGGQEKATVYLCPLCRSEVNPAAVRCPACAADMAPLKTEI